MQQLCGLLGNRAGDHRMCMPERCDTNSGQEIEVLAPFRVEQPDALTPDEADRIASVGLEHELGFSVLDCFERRQGRRHDCVPTIVTISVAASGTGPAA